MKTTDRKKAIKALDKIFSLFIRTRDNYTCITCGKKGTNKTIDCGHYIGRQHLRSRWDEKNCHAQCKYCNCYEEGNKGIYRVKLVERYGKDYVEIIEADKRKPFKVSTGDLIVLTMEYARKYENYLITNKRGIL